MASNPTISAASTERPLPSNGVETNVRDLWENELELSVDEALRRIEEPGAVKAWIAKLTGRQLEVLCRALHFTSATRIKDKRESLARCNGQLIPFYLTDQFSRRKGSFAITDLAATVLPEDMIDLCRSKDDETFDTKALLYAMQHADPENLKRLFHLDKIHKSGFARMALKQKLRQPDTSFEHFLQRKKVQQVLEAFDRQKRDQRQSQLKNVIQHHHHHLVFIRRPERNQYILRDGRIQHGHRVEWIILDFADNAKRVNISSDSNEVPLQIANAIASAYFGKEVEYDNECQITYEKQIHNLLDALKAGTCEGLKLLNIEVSSSPLHGVDLRLCHDDPDIVQRALASLERDNGSITTHISRIVKIKVGYRGKRVDVKFEQIDGGDEEYIVRYMDHQIKNATLRKQFEDFMRDTHGIPILSTEKRFAHQA